MFSTNALAPSNLGASVAIGRASTVSLPLAPNSPPTRDLDGEAVAVRTDAQGLVAVPVANARFLAGRTVQGGRVLGLAKLLVVHRRAPQRVTVRPLVVRVRVERVAPGVVRAKGELALLVKRIVERV